MGKILIIGAGSHGKLCSLAIEKAKDMGFEIVVKENINFIQEPKPFKIERLRVDDYEPIDFENKYPKPTPIYKPKRKKLKGYNKKRSN